MKNLNLLAWILVIIGGLNWLLYGLFKWDVVGGIFGGMDNAIARLVYVILGIAAVYSLTLINKVAD